MYNLSMSFEYNWKNKEANFGPPIPNQVSGGTHITFEIILKKDNQFVALRRPNAIPEHELPPQAKDYPNGLLYFCHNLIRHGEPVDEYIKRTIREQAGVGIESYKIVDIISEVQEKDDQWSFMPYVVVELEDIPQTSQEVTEVVLFDKDSIPDDFGWWTKDEIKEFFKEYGL